MTELAQVLRHLPPTDDPRALVGLTTGDDAAVYQVAEDRAIVVTADFFTPLVDDARDFGRIAVANALSDLYAMGAHPLFGLNLVAFPRELLDRDLLAQIILGGSEKAAEAGISILGGHSIDDPEPKYGMVAVGEVDPAQLVTNAGSRPGDQLILTKPLGTGIVTTAIKSAAAPEDLVDLAVRSMADLNAHASAAMREIGVNAATDVTGFGLLGHLRSLLRESGVAATIRARAVPRFPGVRRLIEAGLVPGGTTRNAQDAEADVTFDARVEEPDRVLLADAQTSGGLLISVPEERSQALLSRISGACPEATVIGKVHEGTPGHIRVR